jgi:hypothetical protein
LARMPMTIASMRRLYEDGKNGNQADQHQTRLRIRTEENRRRDGREAHDNNPLEIL